MLYFEIYSKTDWGTALVAITWSVSIMITSFSIFCICSRAIICGLSLDANNVKLSILKIVFIASPLILVVRFIAKFSFIDAISIYINSRFPVNIALKYEFVCIWKLFRNKISSGRVADSVLYRCSLNFTLLRGYFLPTKKEMTQLKYLFDESELIVYLSIVRMIILK